MTPRDPAHQDEVFTAVPTVEALRQAEVLAMRQLSDNIAQLNRNFERLSGDMRELRDDVTTIKAQELKAAITELRGEVRLAMEGQRKDFDHELETLAADIKRVDILRQENTTAIARLRGFIVPLASLGSALLAGAITFLTTLAVQALTGSPPHHP